MTISSGCATMTSRMLRAIKPNRFSWNGGAVPRDGDLVIVDLGQRADEEEWNFKRYELADGRRTLQCIGPNGERVVLESQPRRW